ncbi:MAG: Peptidase conserved region [Gemmatimonadetes bacterium]|nr:Peptidase conserved region [Gemmatimonadota bacterium]
MGAEPRVGAIVVARHPEDGYVCKWVAIVQVGRIELESLAPNHQKIMIPRERGLVVGTVLMVWSDDR